MLMIFFQVLFVSESFQTLHTKIISVNCALPVHTILPPWPIFQVTGEPEVTMPSCVLSASRLSICSLCCWSLVVGLWLLVALFVGHWLDWGGPDPAPSASGCCLPVICVPAIG